MCGEGNAIPREDYMNDRSSDQDINAKREIVKVVD